MREHRLREVLPLRPRSPGGGAKRLPGLRVHSRLRAGSPSDAPASLPGRLATPPSVPRGGRKRLPGLRVHSRLRAGSLDRCASIASGKACHSVVSSPGAAQSACLGYGFTAVCRLIARQMRQHRLREGLPLRPQFPGGGAKRLPGLRVHSRLRAGSPDRCAASPPGKARAMSLVFTQITQQKGNTLPGHRLFEGDFDNDRQRYRKQHPYRTQQPAPENQRQEDHQRR